MVGCRILCTFHFNRYFSWRGGKCIVESFSYTLMYKLYKLSPFSVISGSGDGANVITSSVAGGDVPPPVQPIPSQVGTHSLERESASGSGGSANSRKRAYAPLRFPTILFGVKSIGVFLLQFILIFIFSDHSSSVEIGSDVLEPQKRQRGSPMEQVCYVFFCLLKCNE